jgi:hypothetical protein
MVSAAVALSAGGIPVRRCWLPSPAMRPKAAVTDARELASSTKSSWLAAQSMLSAFDSNERNAYPLEHVCTNRTRGFAVLNLLERVAHHAAASKEPRVPVDRGSPC